MLKLAVTTIILIINAFLLSSCKNNSQLDSNSTFGKPPVSNNQGTVDGGGGDSVFDPYSNQNVLLDLAEGFDKEPFEYEFASVIADSDKKQDKLFALSNMFEVIKLNRLLGEDNEFFAWAFQTALQTNKEIDNEYNDQSLYNIHLKSYKLLGKEVVKNVRYAFTNKDLKPINDEGIIKVSNSETKKQLAAQDLFGYVLIYKDEFNKLDENSKIALKIHETMIYLIIKFNPELIKTSGTAPIREFVRNLFQYYYTAKLNLSGSITVDEVRASFNKLNFPKKMPNYNIIAEKSDLVLNDKLECTLNRHYIEMPNGEKSATANYYFSRSNEKVSDNFAMDVNFYMKLQMHLVQNDTCIFKPQKCEIKQIQEGSEHNGLVRLTIGNLVLPEGSNDWLYVKEVLLKKYQTARICQ